MSVMAGDVTYEPINTLKAIVDAAWIVDGPVIRFGLPWLKMPFPTRMTVFRADDAKLFIHSPTALTRTLQAEIDRIGMPAWIVAPNRIHYWWVPEWQAAYPEAQVYLAPHIRKQSAGRIAFPAHMLAGASGYPWDSRIATLPVSGSYMTEFEFFHRPSRTLVLTDLIENFEPAKLGFAARWLARLGGVLDPDGGMPRDMRLTFSRRRRELRQAVEAMIAWEPERLIVAHGRWYDRNAVAELRRAFRWVLERP
jgi:hypothetical protein